MEKKIYAVADFGAVGDGVADDGPAIGRALKAMLDDPFDGEKELRFAAAKGKAVVERVDFTTAQISKAIGTPAGIVATVDDGFCKAILQGGNN